MVIFHCIMDQPVWMGEHPNLLGDFRQNQAKHVLWFKDKLTKNGGIRVFLWIFGGRVFLWSCMLLDLHVLSFVLFVWARQLVGISLWNISSSIAMTYFWCRNPTMGTPSLTFTNIHENSQLNSYVFFETGQNVPNKVASKWFPSLKLTVRKFAPEELETMIYCHFFGRGNGPMNSGVMFFTSGGYTYLQPNEPIYFWRSKNPPGLTRPKNFHQNKGHAFGL